MQRSKANGEIHLGSVGEEPGGKVGTRQSKESLPKALERARQIWVTESNYLLSVLHSGCSLELHGEM